MQSHCELAEHAHQQHAEDAKEFVVEAITFRTASLRNIASKCWGDPGRLHTLDTVSIQLMPTRDLMASSSTGQHETPAEMYSCWMYGQRALWVDDAFNLTSYLLRLTTVIVADERD
ncbi:hypothetical protein RB195_019748 [Necator americanus]|uniref:Uncharacterized protein n=1 Tax=Necator americanus TaxID=51031 RepID=A0ABR1CFL3_NECAM